MKLNPNIPLKAPIPGENFTSDTRNYPWHRPPQYTGYDETVAAMLNKLNNPKEGELLYSLIELEVPVYAIVSSFLKRHIARGFISIDMALLAAGPVARMIEIIAKSNGQKPDMSTEDPGDVPITPATLLARFGDTEALQKRLGGDLEAETEDVGMGLMAAAPDELVDVASDDEQAAMLGADQEETV